MNALKNEIKDNLNKIRKQEVCKINVPLTNLPEGTAPFLNELYLSSSCDHTDLYNVQGYFPLEGDKNIVYNNAMFDYTKKSVVSMGSIRNCHENEDLIADVLYEEAIHLFYALCEHFEEKIFSGNKKLNDITSFNTPFTTLTGFVDERQSIDNKNLKACFFESALANIQKNGYGDINNVRIIMSLSDAQKFEGKINYDNHTIPTLLGDIPFIVSNNVPKGHSFVLNMRALKLPIAIEPQIIIFQDIMKDSILFTLRFCMTIIADKYGIIELYNIGS